MNYRPSNVKSEYTGGNIWVFWGTLGNGKYFMTDSANEWIYIVDTDPDSAKDLEAWEYDWQQEHIIDEFESDEFYREVLKQAIKNNPNADIKWLLDDLKDRMEAIKKESVSRTMKLTIKESDSFKKSKRLSEKKVFKEGAGAGYTIHVDGLSLFNIKSARVIEYVEEAGWFVDIDGTCTIDNLSADSYYYGTGIIHDVDARIKKIWVNWYWVDDYDDLSNMNESELCDFITEYAHDRLSDADFETVYGGGWTHSTYDGTIDAVDSEHGDVDLVITDKHVVDYIDLAVQGENCHNVYYVVSDVDGTLEALDDEDKAVEVAKTYYETGDYDTITVERDLEYYDVDGMPIETFNDTEVVWNSDDEY